MNQSRQIQRQIQKFLGILCGVTYLLIVWGAVVRTTGSGLGCPDWPLCHGQIIPPFRTDVLIEYVHRLLATLVGLGTLAFAIFVWSQKELRSVLGNWCATMVGLLVLQVALGGVTVRTELHSHIVATHLAVALIFLAALFYMWLRMRGDFDRSAARAQPRTIWYHLSHITLLLLFFQIVLGGLVAAGNAGLACPDFPTCLGSWWPALHGNVALHFLHRLGAVLILLFLSILALGARQPHGARLPMVIHLLLVGVVVQILLGIGSVMMHLPTAMRIAHNAVAVFLFLVLMTATYELRRTPE